MNEVPIGILRDTLRGRTATSPSRECLDAETVAAWADDTLNQQERVAAEAHAAGCARCQALLAAMVKTTPPVAARSWWRMPALGWIVPLTAAAAALVLWISVPYRARQAPSDRVVPINTQATASAPAASAANDARERKADAKPKPVDPLAAAKVLPGVSADAAARLGRAAPRRDAEPSAARDSTVSAPTQANANAIAESARGAAAFAGPPLPPAAPAPPPVPLIAAGEPTPIAPPAAPSASTLKAMAQPAGPRASERASARLLLDASRPPIVIISTNPNNRWRIVDGGTVERSIDGGSTWQAQATGVTVMLTSGASPLPTICWLVGPGGIVLRSTDGRSWQRIAFPEGADLASIRASDDKNATVMTADGRAFSTTDGGASWVRAPRN